MMTAPDPATAVQGSATDDAVKTLNAIEADMNNILVEKSTVVRLCILSMLARTHLLVLGERGLAKTMTVDLLHHHIDGAEKFYALLSKALPPEMLVGNLSIKRLVEDDELAYRVDGHLPTAHLAALDECFKANAVVLNMLLGIINERRFKSNGSIHICPLWSVIGTSNLDEYVITGELAPFRDRFGAGFLDKPVQTDDGFRRIIDGQIDRFQRDEPLPAPNQTLTRVEVEALQAAVRAVTHSEDVRHGIVTLRNRAEADGLRPSARRYGELVKLISAQAVLNGRTETRVEDLILAQHVLWTDVEDQPKAFELTVDYGGKVQKAAAKLRLALDPTLVTVVELKKKVDPTTGHLARDEFVNAADASAALSKIEREVDAHLQDAQQSNEDTSELDSLRREINDAQHDIRKFLGMA